MVYIICVHFNLYLKGHLYPEFYVQVLIKMAYVNVSRNEVAEAGNNMSKIRLNPLLLSVCEKLKFNYELERQFIEMKSFLNFSFYFLALVNIKPPSLTNTIKIRCNVIKT